MAYVIANAARIGRNSPDKDSSPANSYWDKSGACNWLEATKIPRAIARSNRPDSLGRSAGAKLTVMRRAGNSKPVFKRAARTLSLDSRTSVSGNPTIVNVGSPFAKCTSTVTSGASMPAKPRLLRTASPIGF